MGPWSEASSSKALNYWMSSLYKSNVWLNSREGPNNAVSLNMASRHFLRAYSRLALLSFNLKQARFGVTPKVHMFWHVWRSMSDQAAACDFVENPMTQSTSSDEDFIGRFCYLTRCVNPRLRVHRSMQRYLTQVLLIWMHSKRKGWDGTWTGAQKKRMCGARNFWWFLPFFLNNRSTP